MAYWRYAPYVSVEERRAKAMRKMKQLKKKNPDIKPILIDGRTLAKTWWGKSWNVNLERYADYSNRIGRGRSYVRHGSVLDLQIRRGEVRALVQGSRSAPYEIDIRIKTMNTSNWQKIKDACQGQLDSLQELLAGKFPKGLADVFMAQGQGLFPTPEEIEFKCSCPDWAYMCKHVAATLYGIGTRLDENPALFFELRNAEIGDLVTQAVEDKAQKLLDKAKKKSERVMENADLSDVFGIVMEEEAVFRKRKKSPAKKPVEDTTTSVEVEEKPSDTAKKNPSNLKKRARKTMARKKTKTQNEENTMARINAETELLNVDMELENARAELKNAQAELDSVKTGTTTAPRKRTKAAPRKRTKTASRPPSKQNAPLKPSGLVEDIIAKSAKGIGIDELKKKTGFEKTRLYTIVHRLKARKKVKNKEHGIYVKT